MAFDADLLLAGPRGRRLCLEYARACALDADTDEGRDASTAVFWAAHALTDPADRGVVLTIGDDGAEMAGAAFEPPAVTVDRAADALRSMPLLPPTPQRLRDALQASVDRAMYWQPPDGEDLLAARPSVREALGPAAELIAASQTAAWWATGVELTGQWTLPWEGGARPADELDAVLAAWHRDALDDEARAARERPADPTANWSGIWWSIPPHDLVRTTRALGADGPARLWFEEDSFGDDAAVAVPVDGYPARVIEITGPDDWAALCRQHPLDVSAARRHDWYRVTGRVGSWVIPDWRSVAAEADAVHLTVLGYLTAATRPIDVDGERATVLAGWNPDETFWFRGTLARPTDEQRWVRADEGWVRVAP